MMDLNQGKWDVLTYVDKHYLLSNPLDKDNACVFDYPEHENFKNADSDESDD